MVRRQLKIEILTGLGMVEALSWTTLIVIWLSGIPHNVQQGTLVSKIMLWSVPEFIKFLVIGLMLSTTMVAIAIALGCLIIGPIAFILIALENESDKEEQ